VYGATACGDCHLRANCTKAAQRRRLKRYPEDEQREALRLVMQHRQARRIFSQRKAIVEPVFSSLCCQQGLNRFRRSGLQAVKRKFALHVLAFSAVTDTQQTDEWHQRGFAGYIAKPTSPGELEAALGALGAIGQLSEPAPESASEPQGTAESPDVLDAHAKARYVAMLKDHLGTDLPRVSAIVERRDRLALCDWAHSAAGAFLIVGEPQFAAQCRELQSLCQKQEQWTA
jgi:hypothetical protein